MIHTVTGEVNHHNVRYSDAHSHLWIESPMPDCPRLADEATARSELLDFASVGGSLVLDCQPGGAGRDGNKLRQLSADTGVWVVASTGFHLRRYYLPGSGPWDMSAQTALDLFEREVNQQLDEAPGVRAGVIKVAWTGDGGREDELMRAALTAAARTGTAVVVHTEAGRAVERVADLVSACGVRASRVQLSHVDKRPDESLHSQFAGAGFVLGYDSFLREKYDPERNVWPLLHRMIDRDLWRQITLGLDFTEVTQWRVGGGQGLAALVKRILARLRTEGVPGNIMAALGGGNVARLLDRDPEPHATAQG